MAYGRKWKPSKSAMREFAEQMNEIDQFCEENGISRSYSSDSYYFTLNGQNYRVSNHSIKSSKYTDPLGNVKYYHEGEENVIYIHASKTRLIEIYTKLKNGKKLDGRGYEIL